MNHKEHARNLGRMGVEKLKSLLVLNKMLSEYDMIDNREEYSALQSAVFLMEWEMVKRFRSAHRMYHHGD
jgi:hypothetical protein